MNKIKVKDKVLVLSGKDKGKVGIVSSVLKDKSTNKILLKIDGINLYKKHLKANPNKNKSGGIVSIEKYINYSNVSLFCSNLNKRSRVFFDFSSNKKKSRFFKINKEVVN